MSLNPYWEWLGIPREAQPANYYQLLGLAAFESDPVVIRQAADERMDSIRLRPVGRFADIARQLLDELQTARDCLLDPQVRLAYDLVLQMDFDQPSADPAPVVLMIDQDPDELETPAATLVTPHLWEPSRQPLPSPNGKQASPSPRQAAAPPPPAEIPRPPAAVSAKNGLRKNGHHGRGRETISPVVRHNFAEHSHTPGKPAPGQTAPRDVRRLWLAFGALAAVNVACLLAWMSGLISPRSEPVLSADVPRITTPGHNETPQPNETATQKPSEIEVADGTQAESVPADSAVTAELAARKQTAEPQLAAVDTTSTAGKMPRSGSATTDTPPSASTASATKPEDSAPSESSVPSPATADNSSAAMGSPASTVRPTARPTTVASAASTGSPGENSAAQADPAGDTDSPPQAPVAKPMADPEASSPPQPVTPTRKAQPAKLFTSETPLPVPPPAVRSPSDLTAYLEKLKQLTDMLEGATRPHGTETAQQHFESARKFCDQDPRLHYAYGLVLLKYARHTQAGAEFTAATKLEDYPYLPAWQAAIWSSVNRKQYDPACEWLLDLARVLEHSPAPWPTPGLRRDAALWAGQVIGFLTECAGLPDARLSSINTTDEQILKILTGTSRDAYLQGKELVRLQRSAMEKQFEQTRAHAEKQQQQELEISKDEIAEQKEKVADEKEKLQMSASAWKKWIDEQLARFDKELNELEQQYRDITTRGDALEGSMVRLAGEISAVEQMATTRLGNEQVILTLQAAQKRAAYDQLQAQYSILDRQAFQVRRQGQGVLNKRAAAIHDYQKATGKLVKQGDSLQKWTKMLDRKDQDLPKRKGVKARKVRMLEASLQSLGAYIDFDYEAERERILSSYVGK